MQVVHVDDARERQQLAADRVEVDVRGRDLQQHAERARRQPPRTREDPDADHRGDDRVDRCPAGGRDHDRGHDHADRAGGVGHRVDVGAAHREAVLRAVAQHEEHDEVHHQPGHRDHEHRARRRRWCRRRPDAGSPRPARSPRPRTSAPRSPATPGSRAGTARRCGTPSCDARFATTIEPRARAMATPSVSMWAASESRARDPVTNAVTASTTTKVAVRRERDPEPPDVAGGGAAQGVAVVVTGVRGAGAARDRGPSRHSRSPGCSPPSERA